MLILSYLGLVINYAGLFSGRFQHTSFTVCSKNGPALFLICTLFFALNFLTGLDENHFIVMVNLGLLQMRERISCFRGLTYKIKPRELRVEVGV